MAVSGAMRVDYYPPPGPMEAMPAQARRAAGLGYDGFFTAETAHDPFLGIAASAQSAPRLEYGTAIAVAFARSPMVTAVTAWDLARATGGRFLLGLGTQVKAHITARFSMPWDQPAARLREYVGALRAIWDTWQNGTPLRYVGEYYRFTLMTPFFAPGPLDHPAIPVSIAAVGPIMARLAGEVCDGIHIHPFHTVRYLREVVEPALAAGAVSAGRDPDAIERSCTVMIVTGADERRMAAALAEVKSQIAFYASTPTYRRVLELEGWDFGPRLASLARRGQWDEMAALIPDEVVEQVAVVAPLERLGAAVRQRYGTHLTRVGFYPAGLGSLTSSSEWGDVIAAVRSS